MGCGGVDAVSVFVGLRESRSGNLSGSVCNYIIRSQDIFEIDRMLDRFKAFKKPIHISEIFVQTRRTALIRRA